jgi:type IV secretion/conjugal transfer VirB4 family ATPase
MPASTAFSAELKRERSVASFIPYSSHITPTTLVTREGDYVRMWRVAGISHIADPADLQLRLDQWNTTLRSLGIANVAIWTHLVRRRISERLDSRFDNDFCRAFDRRYYDSFSGYRMMANELYLTLVYRPVASRTVRALNRARRAVDELRAAQAEALKKFDEISYQVEASMQRYGVEALATYEHGSGSCSELLEVLNYLLTGSWPRVRVPHGPLNEYLGNAWLFAGVETIEIRTPARRRFAQILELKDYTDYTEPGVLDALMNEPYEFILTQSFSFLSKADGKAFLERQHKQLLNAEDASATQIDELAGPGGALDQLVSGRFAMGEYHFSLLVFGDSVDEIRRNATSATATLGDLGFLACLATTATDAAFFAQLPGNWFYRPRIAVLTSLNFAGLSSFHNFLSGKRDANPWGPAVTLLKSPSGQPYYFNFHFAPLNEDSFDKKLLGNTRIIGASGAGKTVLLGTLLCQAQKFRQGARLTTVFFDKDRGAELVIRALGGRYLVLRNGQPTGFNPLQLEPTEANILFLEKWVACLAAREQLLTTADELRISQAVRTVMRMPARLRRLTTVTQNMTEGSSKEERESSVAKRLAKWCQGGPLGWVFDNPEDGLDFEAADNFGIDGTDFLDNETIRTPLAMYLLHRMESVIDGRRFIYFMDEFWKWVNDPAFADFAGNKQLTIRKQNGLGVFATQMPSSMLRSPIAAALVQQVATEIYLPNPKADFKEYTEGLKVTQAEFELIKGLPEDSRMFLIKQGQQTAIASLDLAGCDDELAVLSGSTDNVQLLDEVLKDRGEDPAHWLPEFHRRRKARRLASREEMA